MHSRRAWTPADIEALPEDERFELLNGEPVPALPMVFGQMIAAGRLQRRLAAFVDAGRLGVVGCRGGFVLPETEGTLLAPDVVFVARERLPKRAVWEGFPSIAPDLAVEVLAPGDTVSEINGKTLAYLDAGVRAVWIMDPRRRIVTVHTPGGLARLLREGEDLTGGEVLPGFSMAVAELFA